MKGNWTRGKQRRGATSPWRNDPIKLYGAIAEPAAPTAWEEFLRDLGLTEDAALGLALGRVEGPRLRLRNWVREHRRNRFVPDAVLAALGLALNEAQISVYPAADGAYRASGKWRARAAE